MAVACRERFAADYALGVGPAPASDASADTAERPKLVHVALAGPDGVRAESVRLAAHPETRDVYCAKSALNMTRLAMIEQT
jgi:hypothetical protein